MKTTINNIDKILFKFIPIGIILFGVSSCSVSQPSVAENDGIYYDPSAQPTQEVVVEDTQYQHQNEEVYTYQDEPAEQPVRIGGRYFDDAGNAPVNNQQNTQVDNTQYNNDRVIANNSNAGSYDQWGDYEGVEVHVINFYGPGYYNWNRRYYGSWYGPYRSFGWNYYGWNSWGYSPFYSSYFGFGYPYYSYGGFYGPYSPYYSPYYYGYGYGYYGHPYYTGYYGHHGHYHHDYYGDRVMREVSRGKGIQNGITRNNSSNRNSVARSGATRSNNNVRSQGQTRTRNSSLGNVNGNSIRTSTRGNKRVDTDVSPVRIRPRSVQEVRTNGGVRRGNVDTNIRSTMPSREIRNTPRPTRGTKYNNVRTRSSQPKATPQRTPSKRNSNFNNNSSSRRSSPSFRSSSSSSMRSSSTSSGSSRSSGGSRGVRR